MDAMPATRMANTLGELAVTREDVAKFLKVDAEIITVSFMNGKVLVVTLANSPLSDEKDVPKKDRAKDVARVAYRSFARRADLETVDVVLQKNGTV